MDKHIRRLDADLARFENELKEKLELSGYESTDGRALKSVFANREAFGYTIADFMLVIKKLFSAESDLRGQREKRGSQKRGRKGSDEDSPKKKKMKSRSI